jgi:hypothetical protein
MYPSVDIFFYLVGIDTARNRLKILLWFFLCNLLSISFPTTLRPLCLFRTHNNNNNNSLSLCTLTLHITPCERMRGDFSVCRQSHTAGTLAVSSSSTVKWTVWNSWCNIRCHAVAPRPAVPTAPHSAVPVTPHHQIPFLPNQQSPITFHHLTPCLMKL